MNNEARGASASEVVKSPLIKQLGDTFKGRQGIKSWSKVDFDFSPETGELATWDSPSGLYLEFVLGKDGKVRVNAWEQGLKPPLLLVQSKEDIQELQEFAVNVKSSPEASGWIPPKTTAQGEEPTNPGVGKVNGEWAMADYVAENRIPKRSIPKVLATAATAFIERARALGITLKGKPYLASTSDDDVYVVQEVDSASFEMIEAKNAELLKLLESGTPYSDPRVQALDPYNEHDIDVYAYEGGKDVEGCSKLAGLEDYGDLNEYVENLLKKFIGRSAGSTYSIGKPSLTTRRAGGMGFDRGEKAISIPVELQHKGKQYRGVALYRIIEEDEAVQLADIEWKSHPPSGWETEFGVVEAAQGEKTAAKVSKDVEYAVNEFEYGSFSPKDFVDLLAETQEETPIPMLARQLKGQGVTPAKAARQLMDKYWETLKAKSAAQGEPSSEETQAATLSVSEDEPADSNWDLFPKAEITQAVGEANRELPQRFKENLPVSAMQEAFGKANPFADD